MLTQYKVDSMLRQLGLTSDADIDRFLDSISQNTPEIIARSILTELDIPEYLVGFEMTIQAVCLVIEDPLLIHQLYKGLYPLISDRCGGTQKGVDSSIRNMLDAYWHRCNESAQEKYFGKAVADSGDRPSNGKFIARIVNATKMRMLASGSALLPSK